MKLTGSPSIVKITVLGLNSEDSYVGLEVVCVIFAMKSQVYFFFYINQLSAFFFELGGLAHKKPANLKE